MTAENSQIGLVKGMWCKRISKKRCLNAIFRKDFMLAYLQLWHQSCATVQTEVTVSLLACSLLDTDSETERVRVRSSRRALANTL